MRPPKLVVDFLLENTHSEKIMEIVEDLAREDKNLEHPRRFRTFHFYSCFFMFSCCFIFPIFLNSFFFSFFRFFLFFLFFFLLVLVFTFFF